MNRIQWMILGFCITTSVLNFFKLQETNKHLGILAQYSKQLDYQIDVLTQKLME